jgi:hypothetical protein
MTATKTKIELWGPWVWKALHIASDRYDATKAQDVRHMKVLVNELPLLLPCQKCIDHYKGLLVAHPPDYLSPRGMRKWYIDIHNSVNKKIHKPVWPYRTAEAAIRHWAARHHLKKVLGSISTVYDSKEGVSISKKNAAHRMTVSFMYFLGPPLLANSVDKNDFERKSAFLRKMTTLGLRSSS